MLVYNEDIRETNKTLRILGLKKLNNAETTLRYLLEAYSYLKIMKKDKFIKTFSYSEITMIRTFPLGFFEGA